jgi:hypothetical protein
LSVLRSPRLWLWLGVVLLLVGVSNAIRAGGLGSLYGIGYTLGSLFPGLAIMYVGWYRRRER